MHRRILIALSVLVLAPTFLVPWVRAQEDLPDAAFEAMLENIQAPAIVLHQGIEVGDWVEYDIGNGMTMRFAVVGTRRGRAVIETDQFKTMGLVMAYVVDEDGKVLEAFAGKAGRVGRSVKVMEAQDVGTGGADDYEIESEFSKERIEACDRELETTRIETVVEKDGAVVSRSKAWYSTDVPGIMFVATGEDGEPLGAMVRMEATASGYESKIALKGFGEGAEPTLELPGGDEELASVLKTLRAQHQVAMPAEPAVGLWTEYTHPAMGPPVRWSIVGRRGDHWVVETTQYERLGVLLALEVDDEGRVQRAFAGPPGFDGQPIQILRPADEEPDPDREYDMSVRVAGEPTTIVLEKGGRHTVTAVRTILYHKGSEDIVSDSTAYYSTDVIVLGSEGATDDEGNPLGGLVRIESRVNEELLVVELTGMGTDAKSRLILPD